MTQLRGIHRTRENTMTVPTMLARINSTAGEKHSIRTVVVWSLRMAYIEQSVMISFSSLTITFKCFVYQFLFVLSSQWMYNQYRYCLDQSVSHLLYTRLINLAVWNFGKNSHRIFWCQDKFVLQREILPLIAKTL